MVVVVIVVYVYRYRVVVAIRCVVLVCVYVLFTFWSASTMQPNYFVCLSILFIYLFTLCCFICFLNVLLLLFSCRGSLGEDSLCVCVCVCVWVFCSS